MCPIVVWFDLKVFSDQSFFQSFRLILMRVISGVVFNTPHASLTANAELQHGVAEGKVCIGLWYAELNLQLDPMLPRSLMENKWNVASLLLWCKARGEIISVVIKLSWLPVNAEGGRILTLSQLKADEFISEPSWTDSHSVTRRSEEAQPSFWEPAFFALVIYLD